MEEYHDREWGVPLHGDKELFAKLILDGFQAGLSWAIIRSPSRAMASGMARAVLLMPTQWCPRSP